MPLGRLSGAALGVAILALATSAQTEALVTCGASAGQGYFFDSDLLPPGEAGWREDAISNGSVTLDTDGTNVDILLKDIIGVISSRSEGATVTLVDAYDAFVTVLVNYTGGAKELYTFDLNRRMFVWSQHKFGVLIDKAHTMVGNCP